MKSMMTGVAMAALLAASPAVAGNGLWQLAQADDVQIEDQMQATETCAEGATETADGEMCPPDTAAAPVDEESTIGDEATDAADADLTAEDDATDAAEADMPLAEEDPMATGSLQSDEPAGMTGEDSTELAAASGEKFIGEQADDAVLASDLIGLTVYNQADETLGDVNDIVWTESGQIDAVIVGVGGFLGIGEKSVAVAYSAIDVSTDENGDTWILLDATSDELAAAPEFLTVDQKQALLEQERMQQEQEQLQIEPAPAPEPAPAQ